MLMPANSRQHGFTLIELSFAALISMVVLGALMQLMVNSNLMYVRVKERSDRLIDKTLVKNQLDFYMERWGKGVAAVAGNKNGVYPVNDRFAHVLEPNTAYSTQQNAVSHTDFDSLEFLGNLEGYGIVESINGSQANILSCRLSAPTNQSGSGCYSIIRQNDYWLPAEIRESRANIQSMLSLSAKNALDLNDQLLTYIHLEGFNRIHNTQECIDQSHYEPNATLQKNLSFYTAHHNQALTTEESYQLEEGDFLQPLPQKVKLYVQRNADDNRNYWLYITTSPVSENLSTSYCPEAVEETAPIAPVRRFKVDNSDAGRLVMTVVLGYPEASRRNQNQAQVAMELEYFYGS